MKHFTPATPRYRIESVKGDYFDVFSKRKNAIRAAIALATEYPGTTFLVVKRANHKRTIIFRYQVELQFQFEDAQNVYQAVTEVFQKKYNKTKYWRKLDESDS